MMFHKKRWFLFLSFTCLLGINDITGQGLPMGAWRTHLPYNQVLAVEPFEGRIIAAAPQALFALDPDDFGLRTYSKVNGLNGAQISALGRINSTAELLVGYESGKIDVIKQNQITPLFDIDQYGILGSKKINAFYETGNRVFIASDFGAVEYNPVKREFEGPFTYTSTGEYAQTFDLESDSTFLYAGTINGVFRAPLNHPNLLDFNAWEKIPGLDAEVVSLAYWDGSLVAIGAGDGFNDDYVYLLDEFDTWETFLPAAQWEKSSVRVFDGLLFVVNYFGYTAYRPDETTALNFTSSSASFPIRPRDVYYNSSTQDVWIADGVAGLVRNYDIFKHRSYYPNSPANYEVYNLSCSGGNTAFVAGGITSSWGNAFLRRGVNFLIDDLWQNTPVASLDSVNDLVAIEHFRNSNRLAAGSWGGGLFILNADTVWNHFDATNSPLTEVPGSPGQVRVGGVAVGDEDDVWVTNAYSTTPLLHLSAQNEWSTFALPGSFSGSAPPGKILRDTRGYLWIQRYRSGVVVYDPSTGAYRTLSTNPGQGNLTSNIVTSMAEDLSGVIWVGTSDGVSTFYNARSLFEGGSTYDAQHILIDVNGTVDKLLKGETVTAIAVDGGNRKWFGTAKNGVFLVSEDGTSVVFHFTESNAPLLSNAIYDIEIDQKTGEVFIATEDGLISFKSTATAGERDYDDVYVYPNPVKPNYEGYITVQNTVENSSVYISDLSGNVVFRGVSEGGAAVWDGLNFDGIPAPSGVYLVYMNTPDGTQKQVAKFVIVR